MHLNNIEPA